MPDPSVRCRAGAGSLAQPRRAASQRARTSLGSRPRRLTGRPASVAQRRISADSWVLEPLRMSITRPRGVTVLAAATYRFLETPAIAWSKRAPRG